MYLKNFRYDFCVRGNRVDVSECIYEAHPLVKDAVAQLQAKFEGLRVTAQRLRWCEGSGGPELWFTVSADITVPMMWNRAQR